MSRAGGWGETGWGWGAARRAESRFERRVGKQCAGRRPPAAEGSGSGEESERSCVLRLTFSRWGIPPQKKKKQGGSEWESMRPAVSTAMGGVGARASDGTQWVRGSNPGDASSLTGPWRGFLLAWLRIPPWRNKYLLQASRPPAGPNRVTDLPLDTRCKSFNLELGVLHL